MQKRQINAIIDLALLVFFIVVALSSIVLFFFLPSGGGSGFRVFLGVRRVYWVDFHVISGFIFLVLMAVHMILHVPYFRKIRSCLSSGKSRICAQE